MKKFFLLTLAIVVAWTAAIAVPAKPGLNTVSMSDGTTLQVQVLGDEWSHSLATADGLTIAFGDDGLFYYVVSGNITNVRALAHADLDVINVGAAISRAENPAAAYQELVAEIDKNGVVL